MFVFRNDFLYFFVKYRYDLIVNDYTISQSERNITPFCITTANFLNSNICDIIFLL